jgi:hypothetical protein
MWRVYDYHRGGVCGRVYVYQGGVYVYQGPFRNPRRAPNEPPMKGNLTQTQPNPKSTGSTQPKCDV